MLLIHNFSIKTSLVTFCFLPLFLACSPIKEGYLKDIVVNYSETGFLSEDIFQVYCTYQKTEDDSIEQVNLRKNFFKTCQKELLKELLIYKIKHDLFLRSYGQLTEKKKNEIELKLDEKQYGILFEHYSEILPGYLVKEKEDMKTLEGVYRAEKNNLIGYVQSKELPFNVEFQE